MELVKKEFLWLLALVPPLVAWAVRGRGRRARQWAELGQGGEPRGDGAAGWIAAIALLILALAQPRWGRLLSPPSPPGRDVVLLVDTSRSMGAEDAVPDRLGLAVDAAGSFVRALGSGRGTGDRLAVVAFSGRGVLRCPLTENLGAVLEALQRLSPGDVRPGGTDLARALDAALDAFGPREQSGGGGRTILLFSDGEDHGGPKDAVIGRLREAGVIVHALAIGDAAAGHPVPSGRGGGGGTLSYRGAPVLSRREDRALAEVATATGGAFVPIGLAVTDLGELYVNRIEPVAREKRLAFRPTEHAERFGWFVLAAMAAGLAGSWPRRGRIRAGGWGRVRPEGRPRRLATPSVAAAFLFLFVGLASTMGASGRDDPAASAVEAGRAAYGDGRWAEALDAFERARALEPGVAVTHYNAAAALFQLQRYPEALERYRAARELAGAELRTKIDYALGNTMLALGDVGGAIRHYDDCLASNAPGADLDAVRSDAAINRQFAEESARRSPSPPQSDEDPSPPRPRPPGSNGRDDADPNRDATNPGGPGTSPGDRPPAGDPSNRRGPGGAGGSGAEPPREGSPDQQLEAAVERIRDARSRRLPDQPPTSEAAGDRKDW